MININNLQISLPNNEKRNKGTLTAATLSNVHYRIFDITYENINISDVYSVAAVPVIGGESLGADYITVK